MISITCTNCKTLLTIDDAFAGGVCRCQHCGTIQTVPAAGTTATAVKEPKALYHNPARADAPSGTGLDDLANVVASSGLGSGLGSGLRNTASSNKPPVNSRTAVLLGIAGGIIVMLIVVLVWLLVRGEPKNPNIVEYPQPVPGDRPGGVAQQPAGSSKGPEFCGVSLAGANSIVYVLDRGSGTQNYFSSLKEACFASLESIGPERKFEIVFWDNGSGDTAYPENSTTFATKDNIESARRALEDVYAFGQTDISAAMKKAVARKPDVIIIATGKGWDLDDSFVKTIDDIRQTTPVKIHTFSLGQSSTSNALRAVANMTGGQFKEISEGALKQFAK